MTKQSLGAGGFGVRDADVAVWGADPGGRGWEGGYLERVFGPVVGRRVGCCSARVDSTNVY